MKNGGFVAGPSATSLATTTAAATKPATAAKHAATNHATASHAATPGMIMFSNILLIFFVKEMLVNSLEINHLHRNNG